MSTRLTWLLGTGALVLAALGGLQAAERAGEVVFHDDFRGTLSPGWSIDREDRAWWRTGPAGLEVRVQPGNMWGGANNARNVFIRNLPDPAEGPIEISLTVSNQPTAQWEQANLVWYYDGGHMVKLGQELVTGRLSIVMGREEGDRARTIGIVPLDAHEVELRLQAGGRQVRGQYRTAVWPEWRDVGECDLPVKGAPKASLHFYNGPAAEEHWIRVSQFTVRRLPVISLDWPQQAVEEKFCRSTDEPRVASAAIPLSGAFRLSVSTDDLVKDPKAIYDARIARYSDGAYVWNWNRRTGATGEPLLAGVGLECEPAGIKPRQVTDWESAEVELDVVSRLEDDHGDHELVLLLSLRPAGRVAIVFDWYGPAGKEHSIQDGFRAYQAVTHTNEVQYRLADFQGPPPRVNLKPFIDDAVRRGVGRESELDGVWLGNRVGNGSRGRTLVRRFDLRLNGTRYSSVARTE